MLQEADMALTNAAMTGDRYAGDDKVFAQFFSKPVQNAKKSDEAGRPIFEDRDYIKIIVPGDKSNIVSRPARDTDKVRFPRQWAAYENQQEQPLEGTPLAEWPAITRSQVEELKFMGIHTVEALVSMPDTNNFMGAASMREKAKVWLEQAAADAPVQEMAAQIEALNERIAELEGEETDEYEEIQDSE